MENASGKGDTLLPELFILEFDIRGSISFSVLQKSTSLQQTHTSSGSLSPSQDRGTGFSGGKTASLFKQLPYFQVNISFVKTKQY